MKPQFLAMAMTVLSLVGHPAAAETGELFEREALDAAKAIARAEIGELPVILTGIRPGYVSGLAEAWTVRDAETGAGTILVFTGSQTFRCAMAPRHDHQCTIKLASVLTHEAWHLRYGADERQAYDRQLVFLGMHGASGELIAGVRLARRFVLARRS